MTAHEVDNMVSRFLEKLNKAQIAEIIVKAIPVNTKKVTKSGLGGLPVCQGMVLYLNTILHLNLTREAKFVTRTRNNCQLPSLLTNCKIRHKIQRR